MYPNRKRILTSAALTAMVVLAATFCSRPDQPVEPGSRRVVTSPLPAFSKMLPHATHDVSWAGTLHLQAMRELESSRAIWADSHHGSAVERKCAALSSLVTKYGALVGQRLALSDDQVKSIVRNALATQQCAVASPMMLWPVASVATRAPLAIEDTATGAYQDYVSGLEDAMSGASNPDQVASGMDNVLASATDLSSGDMEILEDIASVGVSSAYEWYDEEQSGQLDVTVDSIHNLLQSVFPQSHNWWGGLGWSDLLGSVTGAAATCTWTAGIGCTFVPQAAMGGAIVGGIAASGGYLIGLAF